VLQVTLIKRAGRFGQPRVGATKKAHDRWIYKFGSGSLICHNAPLFLMLAKQYGRKGTR